MAEGYKFAIRWLAYNDDCEYLNEEEGNDIPLSVAASLVADIFKKEDVKVIADVRKEYERIHNLSE